MSFYESNRNFIQIKLRNELNHLSKEDRLVKYAEIKSETRNRLSSAYNVKNPGQFYRDAFSVLQEFEYKFLLRNVLFETSSVGLLNLLYKSDNLIHSDGFSLSLEERLANRVISICHEQDKFSFEDLEQFIMDEFIQIVDSVSESDWKSESATNNPLITKYSSWLLEKLESRPSEEINDSFVLFTKIWNYYSAFSHPFNNTKAIVFYNKICSGIENHLANNSILHLPALVENVKAIFKETFVQIDYIPFIDDTNNENYKSGYLTNRDKLNSLISRMSEAGKYSVESTFEDLLNEYMESNDQLIQSECKKALIDKIESYEYPGEESIKKIIELINNREDPAFHGLGKNLYLFEIL